MYNCYKPGDEILPRFYKGGIVTKIANTKEIGQRCKKFRERLGYYQSDVANQTGYSKENISAFENGRNDNVRIFLWYVEMGLFDE